MAMGAIKVIISQPINDLPSCFIDGFRKSSLTLFRLAITPLFSKSSSIEVASFRNGAYTSMILVMKAITSTNTIKSRTLSGGNAGINRT